ncbi:MAG TPA: Crp/Fnr family transcriptional regulator [Flavitalea sp.]|nr:Crp/Fnr family transcriptional regulator [Flavitalea sp.]
MVKALKQFLSRFAVLDEKDYLLLASLGECRSFNKKIRLVDVGDIDSHLNLVIKGLVRKYIIRGEEEIITQIAREGELVSSSVSFLTESPSGYIIETIEPTILFSFTFEQIEELYRKDAKWERLGRLIITDLYLQNEQRDLDQIRYTTRERFLKFVEENPEFLIRVPQKFLASYLQIQPETFSRLKHLLHHHQ